jgi:enoyl-CoA hydratase/carnithine racemase
VTGPEGTGAATGSAVGSAAKARVELVGAVAEIVVDGPPLNLFDDEMIGAVEAAVAECDRLVRAGSARAVLVRGTGEVFCAGVDVHEFQGLTPAGGGRLLARFLTTVQTLEALPVPTVAAVHGLTLTIGFELVLGCDLLWASDNARLGLVEATVGLTPGGGGTQRLVARAGVARAAEAVLTGRTYPAAELQAWGVVNHVTSREALLDEARAFAASLAAGPTVAAGLGKRLLLSARDHGVAAADALTPRVVGAVFGTRDLDHGIASLLEHGLGKAVFEGR